MQFKSTLAVVAFGGSVIAAAQESACLKACSAGDVMCEAACVGTAHPSKDQANATIDCVRNQCIQGTTATENQQYGECVQSCIAQNFPTASGATTVSIPSVTYTPTSIAVSSAVPTTLTPTKFTSASVPSSSPSSSSRTNSDSPAKTPSSQQGAASSSFKTSATFAAIAAVLVAAIAL